MEFAAIGQLASSSRSNTTGPSPICNARYALSSIIPATKGGENLELACEAYWNAAPHFINKQWSEQDDDQKEQVRTRMRAARAALSAQDTDGVAKP
jgi:hypothetical protein